MSIWRLPTGTIDFADSGPLGVGIVNVTTDSMYEGARSGTPERAVADGLGLVEAGFELLDVGAVAARSGPTVAVSEETGRLIPAIEGLVARAGVPITADTFNSEVARTAAGAGAAAINDIGGGRDEMLEVVAEAGCGLVLMHIEGPPRVERPIPDYADVVALLLQWFGERIERAEALGVAREAIAIDPGLDFDLSTDDDLEILRRLPELHQLGRPLFVSLSRKDFIGAVLAGSWEGRWEATDRGPGTVAAATLAATGGVQLHRLHDPAALDAIHVAAAIRGQSSPSDEEVVQRGAFSSLDRERTV